MLGKTALFPKCEITARSLGAKNQRGQTPLHVASIAGQTAAVQFLLAKEKEHRANVIDEQDESGATAIYYAAVANHVDTVVRLIDAGAQVNAKWEDPANSLS